MVFFVVIVFLMVIFIVFVLVFALIPNFRNTVLNQKSFFLNVSGFGFQSPVEKKNKIKLGPANLCDLSSPSSVKGN